MPRRPFRLIAGLALAAAVLAPPDARAELDVRLEKEVVEIVRKGDQERLAAYLLTDGHPGATDNDGQPLLVIAARHDRPQMIRELLRFSARPDMTDRMGNSALFWAAREGHLAAAEALLEGGASIDHPNDQGITPLMAAVRADRVRLVRLLIEHGADPRVADYTGRDAFGWAEGPRATLVVNELNKAAR